MPLYTLMLCEDKSKKAVQSKIRGYCLGTKLLDKVPCSYISGEVQSTQDATPPHSHHCTANVVYITWPVWRDTIL